MVGSAYGDISQRTAAYAYTEMLKNTEPVLVLSKFGKVKPIPKNKSETVKFRRVIPFTPVLTPLQEGITPTSHGIKYEDVTVALLQWGEVVTITDKVQDIAEDPVLSDATKEAGRNAGRTLEQVIWGVVKGGTSVFYANGLARTAVNTPITLNRQRAVTRFLKAQKAEKFTEILSGSPNIGTSPMEAAYVCVGHTDLESDIRNMAGFVPTAKYGQRTVISPYEIGQVEDVRYVLSPDLQSIPSAGGAPGTTVVSTNGTAADIYPLLYFGMEAFGLTPLKNSKGVDGSNLAITPTVVQPNTPDKSDPLGQRGFVGWKTWFNAVRLNENWMARVEVAASTLA
jgi:N4-gp56 family major capsid protein